MAFVTSDRVSDTTTTIGTGSVTVTGTAPLGYRTFSAVLTVGDVFYYCIQAQTTGEWETGVGTYTGANVFARTTVLASSNANTYVSFSGGTKTVFMTLAAANTLQRAPSGTATLGAVAISSGTADSLTLTNSTITSLATALSRANGGTGLSAAGANGNVLTSDGTNWTSALPASYGMTLLASAASTSGTQVTMTSIPTNSVSWYLMLVGCSHSSGTTQAIQVEFSSDNGTSWGGTNSLSTAALSTDLLYGTVVYHLMNGATYVKLREGGSFSTSAFVNQTGVINAARFSWGSGGTFDAGQIFIYGIRG